MKSLICFSRGSNFIINTVLNKDRNLYKRYHYKNFDSWQNDRSAYENKFNQKYGHAKHYSRKKKEKSEKKKKNQGKRDKMNFDMGRESGEKYWETSWDSYRSDQPHYSDNDYYADQRNSYDAYENYYTDRNNMEGWNEFVDNWENSSKYEKSKKKSTKKDKKYQTDQSSSSSKTKAKNQFKGPGKFSYDVHTNFISIFSIRFGQKCEKSPCSIE